jgi:hypothetical protein
MLLHSASEITDDQEAPPADHGPMEWKEVGRRLREYARHRASLDAAEAFDLVCAEQLNRHRAMRAVPGVAPRRSIYSSTCLTVGPPPANSQADA